MRIVPNDSIFVSDVDSNFLNQSETLMVDREKDVAEVTAVPDGVLVRCAGTLEPDEADVLAGMLTRASNLVRNRGSDVVPKGDVNGADADEAPEPVPAGVATVTVVPDFGRFRRFLDELHELVDSYDVDQESLGAHSAQQGT